MGKIGSGYGSEYHLHRLLEQKPVALNGLIRPKLEGVGEIRWLDYPRSSNSKTGKREYKGIEFLKAKDLPPGYVDRFPEIKKSWSAFWPRLSQNWDGVFTSGGMIYLVEAKAHLSEIRSGCTAKDPESVKKIRSALGETAAALGVEFKPEVWCKPYYQFANRLAAVHFFKKSGIPVRCCYIYFLDGFKSPKGDHGVKDVDTWQKVIDEERNHLGLKDSQLADWLVNVFVPCGLE